MNWILSPIGLFIVIVKNTEATECLKNADIGWRKGNIYSCDHPDLPACCEMDQDFTCCEHGHVKHLREQLQLWGSVALFVIVIAVVIIYLTKDFQVFSRDTLKEGVDNFKSKFPIRKKRDEVTFQFPAADDKVTNQPKAHCSKVDIDSKSSYKPLSSKIEEV